MTSDTDEQRGDQTYETTMEKTVKVEETVKVER
jgi:hypothetical protein